MALLLAMAVPDRRKGEEGACFCFCLFSHLNLTALVLLLRQDPT